MAAHSSFPRAPGEQGIWLERYAAFAIASGADPDQARTARDAIEASVNMLSPEEDEGVLRNSGFADATLFWSAFTWRGWIGHAGRRIQPPNAGPSRMKMEGR